MTLKALTTFVGRRQGHVKPGKPWQREKWVTRKRRKFIGRLREARRAH